MTLQTEPLSQYFSWTEVTASDTATRLGIDNSLTTELEPAIKYTAAKMEIIRTILGYPIYVNSWYRCPALNAALHSKDTSQHLRGEAVDFTCPQFGLPLQIVQHLSKLSTELQFDQIILEHTWIHIAFSASLVPAKCEVLTLLSYGGYAIGITDKEGNTIK